MLGMAVKGTKFCPHSFVVLSFPWTCRLLQNKIRKKMYSESRHLRSSWDCSRAVSVYMQPKAPAKDEWCHLPNTSPKENEKRLFLFLSLPFLLLLQLFYQAQLLINVLTQRQTHKHRHTHAQMLMFTHTPIHKSKHTVTADNTEKLY